MSKETVPVSNEDALLQEHDDFMRQVSESGVPTYLLQVYGEPTLKQPIMITLKKLARLVIMTILPILLYEVAVLTFWAWMMGTAPLKRIHNVAWSQDLALLIPFLCIVMFCYYVYYLFIYEEESRIDVPKYERPRHEKYMYRAEDDRP